jgi:hypothetical protein
MLPKLQAVGPSNWLAHPDKRQRHNQLTSHSKAATTRQLTSHSKAATTRHAAEASCPVP